MARGPRAAKRAPRTSRSDTSAQGPDPGRRAIEAALKLAAEKGWRGLALADIAEAAGLSLAELYALYPSKGAILGAFLRGVDREVLAETEAPEGPAKDRLFDVLMRRFDKLEPHKAALERIGEDSVRDPLAVMAGLCRLERSMAAMLEAAGVSASGLGGMLKVKGLTAVYLRVLRVWFRDETADKSKTMASLDRGLGRAARLAGFYRDRRSAGAEA